MTVRQFFARKKKIIRYRTFEFYHKSFGVRRFVQNQFEDKSFGLESNAERNPGETVQFQAVAAEITDPKISDDPVISLDIQMGRVGSLIKPELKKIKGIERMTPIECIIRDYLSTDLTSPASLPVKLWVRSISIDNDNVAISAEDSNPQTINVGRVYTVNDFKGLKYIGQGRV